MTTTDKRKRSLYFPDTILQEMQLEAKRQERSLSWIVQYAWRIARNELMRLPAVSESNKKAEAKNNEQTEKRNQQANDPSYRIDTHF